MDRTLKALMQQIEALTESVETDAAVIFLETLTSNLNEANDPLDARDSGDQFKRLILVLNCHDRLLSSGLVKVPQGDFDKLRGLCNVQALQV